MSPDTKLILEKLEKEGKLLRKDDRTYNLKKVIAANEKTAEAVAALKGSMGVTNEVIKQQTKLEQLRDERTFKLEKLSQEEKEEYEKTEKENTLKEQEIKNRDLKNREKQQLEQEKKDKKIFGKDGILVSTLKDTFSFAKQFALFAALGAVGYEFIAGVLEATFPETFGPEGSIGEIPTIFEAFGSLADVFKSTDLEQLRKNLSALADPAMLANLGITIAGGAAVNKGLEMLTYAAMLKAITPGDADVGELSKKGGALAVRGGIAAILFAATNAAWPKLETYIRTQFMGMSPEEIAQLDPSQTSWFDTSKYAVQGALTLGTMFGPKGAAVGLIGGFLLGLGMMGLDYLENQRTAAEVEFQENYGKQFDTLAKGLRGETLEESEVKDLEELAREGIKRLNETTNDRVKEQLQQNLEVIGKALLNNLDEADISWYQSLGTERFKAVEREAVRQLVEDGNSEGIARLLRFYQEEGGLSEERAIRRLEGGVLERYFERDKQFGVDESIGEVPLDQRDAIRTLMSDAITTVVGPNQLRGGTNGFKDFGKGSLAVLHGEEAVITKGSLEGQILQRIRSGQALDSQSVKIEEILAAGSMMGGGVTTVINSSPSAPTNVNISKGGDKTAYTKVGGGSNAGSFADMNPGGVLA